MQHNVTAKRRKTWNKHLPKQRALPPRGVAGQHLFYNERLMFSSGLLKADDVRASMLLVLIT